MKPAYVVLNMYQGQTYRDTLTLTDDADVPLDLSAREARMQIRTDTGLLVMELSTENGRILPLDADGVIAFDVTAADLAAIHTQYDYEQWVYDIELFHTEGVAGIDETEIVERPVRGTVVFWPEITVTEPPVQLTLLIRV